MTDPYFDAVEKKLKTEEEIHEAHKALESLEKKKKEINESLKSLKEEKKSIDESFKEENKTISRFNNQHCQTFIKDGEIIKGYVKYCRVGDYFIVLPREKALLELEDDYLGGEYFGKSVVIKWDDKELIVVKWRGQKWPRYKLKGSLSNFTVIDYFITEDGDDEYIRDHNSVPPHWDIFQ
jgi:seryl-tRNA synthetase|tara:strand:- start:838 stop:1377 length:540 start_codon:yes stop_codon:yes gene_type:complete